MLFLLSFVVGGFELEDPAPCDWELHCDSSGVPGKNSLNVENSLLVHLG